MVGLSCAALKKIWLWELRVSGQLFPQTACHHLNGLKTSSWANVKHSNSELGKVPKTLDMLIRRFEKLGATITSTFHVQAEWMVS